MYRIYDRTLVYRIAYNIISRLHSWLFYSSLLKIWDKVALICLISKESTIHLPNICTWSNYESGKPWNTRELFVTQTPERALAQVNLVFLLGTLHLSATWTYGCEPKIFLSGTTCWFIIEVLNVYVCPAWNRVRICFGDYHCSTSNVL